MILANKSEENKIETKSSGLAPSTLLLSLQFIYNYNPVSLDHDRHHHIYFVEEPINRSGRILTQTQAKIFFLRQRSGCCVSSNESSQGCYVLQKFSWLHFIHGYGWKRILFWSFYGRLAMTIYVLGRTTVRLLWPSSSVYAKTNFSC